MAKINYDNYITIESEEQGEIGEYATLWEAYSALKDIKELDRRDGIKDAYRYIHHFTKNNKEYMSEIKITRKKEKLYYKIIGRNK